MEPPLSGPGTFGYKALDRVLGPLLSVFVALSAIVMVAIMALAIFSIFQSILEYIAATVAYYRGDIDAHDETLPVLPQKIFLLVALVKGIELIFVAPLPFLLLLGLARYTQAVLTGGDTVEARDLLETVKLIIAALFISISAAHVVVEFVGGELREAVDFVPMLALIAILAVYVGILNRGHARP